jgi:hypothetical protein
MRWEAATIMTSGIATGGNGLAVSCLGTGIIGGFVHRMTLRRQLVGEMAALLQSQALPEMERLASRAAMIALLSSGRSPGLTEYQCAQYLRELAHNRP